MEDFKKKQWSGFFKSQCQRQKEKEKAELF